MNNPGLDLIAGNSISFIELHRFNTTLVIISKLLILPFLNL